MPVELIRPLEHGKVTDAFHDDGIEVGRKPAITFDVGGIEIRVDALDRYLGRPHGGGHIVVDERLEKSYGNLR